jgi:WD40 repeat protein
VQAQTITELKGHTALVYHVAFSPDGKLLATAGFDNTVKLWEYPSGKEVRTLAGHTGPVYCVAFDPSGTTLASASLDKTIRLWNVADGKPVREIKGHTDIVDSIAFHKDGKLLASGSSDKTVRLWNPADGKEVKNLGAHEKAVYAVSFSPDGKWLASSGSEGGVRIWDVAGLKEAKSFTAKRGPAAQRLWAATIISAGSSNVFSPLALYPEVGSYFGHDGPVTGVLFTPDSTGLWSIGMMDRTVRLWNVADGKEVKKMGPTPDDLYGIALSREGKHLATCGYGGNLVVWNLADGKPTFTHKLKYVTYCLTFTPDGKALVTGHDRPYVCLITSVPGAGN